jgi:hypothetical protein
MMTTSKIDLSAADVQLVFNHGDSIIFRVNMGYDITDRTHTAAILFDDVILQALTCTVVDLATGLIDVSLTSALSAAISINENCNNLNWEFIETNSAVVRTIMSGRVIIQ